MTKSANSEFEAQNTAAVYLLSELFDKKQKKTDQVFNLSIKLNESMNFDLSVLKIRLEFEIEFLNQNIDSLQKQIATQKFNY